VPAGWVREHLFIASNAGSSGATGVTLADTLPAGATLGSATRRITPVNGVLTFHIAKLAKGATRAFPAPGASLLSSSMRAAPRRELERQILKGLCKI
jgi:uncharacterized repeat protein (TIGR01451 family)